MVPIVIRTAAGFASEKYGARYPWIASLLFPRHMGTYGTRETGSTQTLKFPRRISELCFLCKQNSPSQRLVVQFVKLTLACSAVQRVSLADPNWGVSKLIRSDIYVDRAVVGLQTIKPMAFILDSSAAYPTAQSLEDDGCRYCAVPRTRYSSDPSSKRRFGTENSFQLRPEFLEFAKKCISIHGRHAFDDTSR